MWQWLVATGQELERQPTLSLCVLPPNLDVARVEEASRAMADQAGSRSHDSPTVGGRCHRHEDAGKGGTGQPVDCLEHPAQASCRFGKGLMPMAGEKQGAFLPESGPRGVRVVWIGRGRNPTVFPYG